MPGQKFRPLCIPQTEAVRIPGSSGFFRLLYKHTAPQYKSGFLPEAGITALLTHTVPCLFCGKDHTVTCSSHAFLHEKVLAFSCAASGLDCCYVGEEGPVFAALQRLEEAVDKLEAASGEKGAFLDELVMQEVLSDKSRKQYRQACC